MAASPYSDDVQAWLMGLGPFPFGEPSIPLPPGSFGNEDQLAFLNDILTAQNKGNNVMSDPAQIAQYGAGAGGFSPDAFQPTVTYESVKAPGYMQMQRYMQSSDPVMSYIAKRLDQGATAVQVETEIRKLVEGGGPQGQAMLAALPMRDDEFSNKSIVDWGRVGAIASGLEKAIIEDPEFNAVDPATGLPANQVQEESEASRYFREAGLPNPYEKFSPDLLADKPTLDRERQIANVGLPRANQAAQSAEDRYAMLVQQLKALEGKPYGDATAEGVEGMPTMVSDLSLNGLPSSALSVATTGQEAEARYNLGQRGGPMQAGALYEPTIKPTTGRRTESQANLHRRAALASKMRAAGRERLDAANQRTAMNNRNQDAIYAQLERQRMIDAMTRAGYTPFNEVMRARQQTIYGQ